MLRLALIALVLTGGVAMATPKGLLDGGPRLREPTEHERMMATPAGRAAAHVRDLYLSGRKDEARRQFEIYQRQFRDGTVPEMQPDEWSR